MNLITCHSGGGGKVMTNEYSSNFRFRCKDKVNTSQNLHMEDRYLGPQFLFLKIW
jgi:hypothetical protein